MTGVTSLGYLGLTSPDVAAFRAFAVDILGLAEATTPGPDPETAYLKMDDRQWRLAVSPGEGGLAYLGWEVDGPTELRDLVAAVEGAGIDVEVADDAAAAERGVVGLARFADPAGFATELFWGQKTNPEPFRSPAGVSGFETGPMGLGHAFLMVPDIAAVEPFYLDVLGLRLTDLIQMGGGKSARFYRCNARHHSLALMDLMPATQMGHFMVEASSIDDVGMANDRAVDSTHKIVTSFGRHSNDRTISFYVQSPAGVDVELGWGGTRIDEATWSTVEFQGVGDLWGHRGEMMDEISDARTG